MSEMGGKFLFVIDSFGAGGAERSLLDAMPALVERGVTPILVALKRAEVGYEDELRATSLDFRVLTASSRFGRILELRRLVRAERPDLVYTSLFEADLVGRLACAGLRLPVVSSLVNATYDESRLADPRITGWKLSIARRLDGITARLLTDHFHAVSEATKESAMSALGLRSDRVTVVKRGRDPDRFRPADPERRRLARSALGLDSDTEVLITVGRHEYQKGHQVLVRAFAEVAKERPEATLLLVGRYGKTTGELRALITGLGLEERVLLLGHRRDVDQLLVAADLFVFPSLFEGLGGALIEALATGLPVVASDLPSVREVVENGENALLVPAGDSPALAAAILELLSDPKRRARYGEQSRRLFEASLTLAEANQALVDLLDRVANRRS